MGESMDRSGWYAGWMFQWAFAAAAATIVSVRLSAFPILDLFLDLGPSGRGLTWMLMNAGCRG